LLNILQIPFASTSSSLIPIKEDGLLSSCIYLSQVLSCLTYSSSVFNFHFIFKIWDSVFHLFSLLEWPSIVVYISVSFFFLKFSISWVTSSLIFFIFIFNSSLYL
jgi:hypothetical protein